MFCILHLELEVTQNQRVFWPSTKNSLIWKLEKNWNQNHLFKLKKWKPKLGPSVVLQIGTEAIETIV